jgi:hypothetical protein
VIEGPSKEHKHTKAKFCGIVIPNGNGKKFLYYEPKPTLEIAIQHSKIKTQVQNERRKNTFKENLTIQSNGGNTRATPKPPRTQKLGARARK